MNGTTLTPQLLEPIKVEIDHIITEDDTPVDNWHSEKQQRLSSKTLYTSWKPSKPFICGIDIGIFSTPHEPPVVPDVLVSLDVKIAIDWHAKRNRSYFLWEFGKPPEIVIEVVSNKEGGELDRKLARYARIGVWYYVVFDPQNLLSNDTVRVYELLAGHYRLRDDLMLDWLNLGLTLWEGEYEGHPATYLRWTDSEGNLLPTDEEAIELSEQAKVDAEERATDAEARATDAEERAREAEEERAELIAKLRAMGIDPDSL